jgi:cell division protein FtsB
MRDIGRRIQRYRLSRYAAPESPIRRRIRWVWVGLGAWLLWAGVVSDHSFYQLWRVEGEARRARRELLEVQAQTRSLEAQTRDPRAREEQVERILREKSYMARRGEIIYRVYEPRRDSVQIRTPRP